MDIIYAYDMVAYAYSEGLHSWEEAREILDGDNLINNREVSSLKLYTGIGEEAGFSKDTSAIIEGFLKKENLRSCLLVF